MQILELTVIESRSTSPRMHILKLEKPEGFSYQCGHYARLSLPGLPDVWRAYSLVSAPHEPWLELVLTRVQGGQLSPGLCALQAGDRVLMKAQAFGFFLPDQLSAGQRLWLTATGSGVGPFIAMLRAPACLAAFGEWHLLWSVREAADLAYLDECRALAANLPALHFWPVVTREAGFEGLHERIPALLADAVLPVRLGQPPLDAAKDRVMVCGNPDFTAEMRQLLSGKGFASGRRGAQGSMVFENYWLPPRGTADSGPQPA